MEAAPSHVVPAPTNNEVSFFAYLREVVSGVATLLQEAPQAVALEAAYLVQEVPVVGIVCKTFLALEQFVETARSNKEDLATLCDLCAVVITGVLDKRLVHSSLFEEGFVSLEKHVKKAAEVAQLCNGGRVKRLVLARRICKDIVSVRNDVLAFCAASDVVINNDVHAKVVKLGVDLDGKIEAMQRLAITQADHEAMRKEVEDLRRVVETKEEASLDLKAEVYSSREALAVMQAELEEQRRIADLARRVKVPPGAPRIRDWYAEREGVVSEACDRFGIGRSSNASGELRMVGLAGPSGAGKSTVASMLIARQDVRASFHKGLLWLQVGQGAKDRLPELMIRLAGMVYETVMLKMCRSPRTAGLGIDPEDGAAYIREVVDESSRRFLVVADDVWEVEVLRELENAGVWVIYTTRHDGLLPEAPSLRLDQVMKEEAELVLRRAAELDDAPLPKAAYDLIERCEFSVMHLALVGRWSGVRGRRDEKAWQEVVKSIEKAQAGGEGEDRLPWRAAVLRAGMEELASENKHNQELYLALAVIPKGFAFHLDVVAVLLHGDEFSAEDFETAGRVAATLERWSVLTLEGGGMYRVHDDHADFVHGCFAAYQNARQRTLRRWRAYISSIRALRSYTSFWLVEMWETLEQVEGNGAISQPFDTALNAAYAADSSKAELSEALGRAARFHWRRKDWMEAYTKNLRMLQIHESTIGPNTTETAGTLHSLGACMHNEGRRDEAKGYYRRALAIRKEKLGDNHLDVARTLFSLGVCEYALEQMTKAEECHREALTIRENQLGADHPDVAKVLHSLGVCVYSTGQKEEAEVFYRRALAIRKAKLRPDHPDLSSTLLELAQCAAGKERFREEVAGLVRQLLAARGGRCLGGGMSSIKDTISYSIGPCAPLHESWLPITLDESNNRAVAEKLGIEYSDLAKTLQKFGTRALKKGRKWEAKEYLEIALALVIKEKNQGDDHPDVTSTMHDLGTCAFEAGRTEEAEEFYRRALAIEEGVLGVNHLDVATTLQNLGECASAAGRIEEAQGYHGRALKIRENQLGDDHLDVATTLNNLGMCALQVGRIEEADAYHRRALKIRENQLGDDHLDVAATLHNLGMCALKAERLEEAEGYHRRALKIREKKLGDDHLEVATTLHNLGECASTAGRAEEAEGYHRRALKIREKQLGDYHVDVAATLHNLGVCALKARWLEEAERYHWRALKIRKKMLGDNHLDVATTLHNLGMCALKAGWLEEAERYHQRALEVRENQLGDDHLDVATTLDNLEICALKAERWGEAEEYHQRALKIREKLGGDVASALDNLGVIALQAGWLKEAEEYHRRALKIREKMLGDGYVDAAATLHNLGMCALKAERLEEAEGYHRRALKIREKKLGDDHLDVATTLDNLEMCALKAERLEEAEGYRRRALKIREKKPGDNHVDVATTLHNLGMCTLEAGRTEEAKEFYRRALKIREEQLGDDHLDVATTLHNLGMCALKAESLEEAQGYHQRALKIREKPLGDDHVDVAITLDNLGMCALKAGRIEEAYAYHRRALKIREEQLSDDHLDVAATLDNLGVCALKARWLEEAEGYHRRALKIREKQLGDDYVDAAATLHSHGMCALQAGWLKEAEEYHRRALEVRENQLGDDHLDVATTLHNLGMCALMAGWLEEAEGYQRRALKIRENQLGDDHLDVATTLDNLEMCALKAERLEEAEGYHQRALKIRKKQLGDDHVDVATTLDNLGMCTFEAGMMEEAEGYHRRALKIREKKLGDDHLDVAASLHNLEMCALKAERLEEAEGYHQRALKIREKQLGDDHVDVATTLDNLGMCVLKARWWEEDKGYRRRALKIREEQLGDEKIGKTSNSRAFLRLERPDDGTRGDNENVVSRDGIGSGGTSCFGDGKPGGEGSLTRVSPPAEDQATAAKREKKNAHDDRIVAVFNTVMLADGLEVLKHHRSSKQARSRVIRFTPDDGGALVWYKPGRPHSAMRSRVPFDAIIQVELEVRVVWISAGDELVGFETSRLEDADIMYQAICILIDRCHA